MSMNRRSFLAGMALTGSSAIAARPEHLRGSFASAKQSFESHRPDPNQRRFMAPAVEAKIEEVKADIRNPELAWLFENCYPNTLDTTVEVSDRNGNFDTFVITGDIAAMWLRDSTEQTAVYIPLARHDAQLERLFRGLMNRQARCVLLDPYANAFYADSRFGDFRTDLTDMKPGVHERKWEIDSLCYPIRLAYLYWEATHDFVPFNAQWRAAAHHIVNTFTVQQRLAGDGPYRFQRNTTMFYDNSPNKGLGNPTRKIGLIHSAFRPSDDACLFPFLIPSNMFAHTSLQQLAILSREVLHDADLEQKAEELAKQLEEVLAHHGTATHPQHGDIIPYEVDGFGNVLWIDDANAPGLLSLPYLHCCRSSDPAYVTTRSFVLSEDNPVFVKGTYAEGLGSPHTGSGTVWPLSIIMRALTSDDETEITACIRTLVRTHAGTGFMHESFDPNNPSIFTRPWFAWCNSLFGELIVTLSDQRPSLLRSM